MLAVDGQSFGDVAQRNLDGGKAPLIDGSAVEIRATNRVLGAVRPEDVAAIHRDSGELVRDADKTPIHVRPVKVCATDRVVEEDAELLPAPVAMSPIDVPAVNREAGRGVPRPDEMLVDSRAVEVGPSDRAAPWIEARVRPVDVPPVHGDPDERVFSDL